MTTTGIRGITPTAEAFGDIRPIGMAAGGVTIRGMTGMIPGTTAGMVTVGTVRGVTAGMVGGCPIMPIMITIIRQVVVA